MSGADIGGLDPRLERTVKFFQFNLNVLPYQIISLDTSRVLLGYFAVSGLDVLNRLDKCPFNRQNIIDWIYYHQLSSSKSENDKFCGFRGGSTLITQENTSEQNHDYDCSHITMIFAALNALLTLGDDLSKVNKRQILNSLKNLQLEDGSFPATFDGGENDIRFVHNACCISYVLNDWSGVNKDKLCSFIKSCLTYEGAFGQNPESEAHGGSTFCAVASLYLMDRMDILTEKERDRLAEWCINRQSKGFNGRVNKPNDSCYSWWVGSTLKMLDCMKYTSHQDNIEYLFDTYQPIVGGFAKWPDCSPDPLHTFMGVCALSLIDFSNLQQMHPALVISMRAHEHLKQLHASWTN